VVKERRASPSIIARGAIFAGQRPCPRGAVAQLEEHLLCKQGVRGSSPLSSTTFPPWSAAFLVERLRGFRLPRATSVPLRSLRFGLERPDVAEALEGVGDGRVALGDDVLVADRPSYEECPIRAISSFVVAPAAAARVAALWRRSWKRRPSTSATIDPQYAHNARGQRGRIVSLSPCETDG
jgi:hypothetical protein